MKFFLLAPLAILTLFSSSCRREEQSSMHKRSSNEVSIRLEAEPDRLNPLLSTISYSRQVFDPLHLYLMNYDPTTLVLVPQLLKETPKIELIKNGVFEGGTKYSFEIREEAVWDDGKPVTAADYEATLKLIFNPFLPTLGYRTFLENIQSFDIDKMNPKKFTIILNDTYFAGLESLTNVVPVLPKHIFDADNSLDTVSLLKLISDPSPENQLKNYPFIKDFADYYLGEFFSRNPEGVNGAGPYKLVSWQSGQEILLEKKQAWWGDKLATDNAAFQAFPDKLLFKIIPDPVSALAALKNEEIDVMQNIAPEDFLVLTSDSTTKAHFSFYTPSSLSSYYISLNTRLPILSDKKVRRAFAHAIDVDELIKNVFIGFGTRCATPLHPSSAEYNADLKPITFSIEKAKKLLAEAGWSDTDKDGILDKKLGGKKTALRVKYLANASKASSMTLAELIKSNARKAGIDVVIDAKDANTLLDKLRSREFEMISAGRSITPQWSPSQNWRTDADNRSGFGNEKTDQWIDALEREPNQSKRWVISKKLQAEIYEEQPEIMLFCPQERLVIHKRFEAVSTAVWPGFHPVAFKLIKD
ncbi:MAG: ABC transporter substrate-binding protein [Saprospiraceae bacterium]|nr:ABC transporter substrate-binding protein [Saprospiraceae bacterium]